MRALWIATSLCLASTVVLAQSTSRTVEALDTCFKLVRVTEANCSTSANGTAQRQECLQNARKVQLACLELTGPQASASVHRPAAAAGRSDQRAGPRRPPPLVSPDSPADAAPPVVTTGASRSAKPVAGASADR